ncbi:MAG TPA: polysaccharide biosynthesis/export family protein [Pirellulaceae bacterium]|nr:polysaccharide biosynthesis/export family protein [Pirellulaceae bacterium]
MNRPAKKYAHTRLLKASFGLLVLCCLGMTGCTQLVAPINSIPANRIPPEFLSPPRANAETIDFALLGQEKPANYTLDEGDVLGIHIATIFGDETQPPIVQFPAPESDLNPSIGFPVPVRENGTISLPLIDPLPVRGLTVPQVEEAIKRAYVQKGQLVDPKVIVTLMRKRTYRVVVIRQDNQFFNQQQNFRRLTAPVTDRTDESARGFVLNLPAYENDLMNALAQTGGLPGINAKNEIKILRAARNQAERQARLQGNYSIPAGRAFPYQMGMGGGATENANVVIVPLRLRPGQAPRFRPSDVILNEGDIVYVESRESEVYYTGGLLGGGEWALPRDYDLDVLGAVAIAGTTIGVDRQSLIGGLAGQARVPPTQLIVLRQLPNNQQIAIEVDLTEAVNNPRSRLLVAPRDTLILRYKPEEEILNFASGTFFTFGIRELFR